MSLALDLFADTTRINWLGYQPSARQPNLANVKPSIDNRWDSKKGKGGDDEEDDDEEDEEEVDRECIGLQA